VEVEVAVSERLRYPQPERPEHLHASCGADVTEVLASQDAISGRVMVFAMFLVPMITSWPTSASRDASACPAVPVPSTAVSISAPFQEMTPYLQDFRFQEPP
jgi:hypothetical protein